MLIDPPTADVVRAADPEARIDWKLDRHAGSGAALLAGRMDACLAANVAAMKRYRPGTVRHTPTELLFVARDPSGARFDAASIEARIAEWRERLAGGADVGVIDADHDAIVEQPAVASLAEAIRRQPTRDAPWPDRRSAAGPQG